MSDIDRFSQRSKNSDDLLVAKHRELTTILVQYPRKLGLEREHIPIDFKVNRGRHFESPSRKNILREPHCHAFSILKFEIIRFDSNWNRKESI